MDMCLAIIWAVKCFSLTQEFLGVCTLAFLNIDVTLPHFGR